MPLLKVPTPVRVESARVQQLRETRDLPLLELLMPILPALLDILMLDLPVLLTRARHAEDRIEHIALIKEEGGDVDEFPLEPSQRGALVILVLR